MKYFIYHSAAKRKCRQHPVGIWIESINAICDIDYFFENDKTTNSTFCPTDKVFVMCRTTYIAVFAWMKDSFLYFMFFSIFYNSPINYERVLVQILAWYWTTDRPGARFTNGFLPAIQIRWKLRLAIILLLAVRSQQIFAHATTAQLSCHVQNFVAIAVLELRWEWNEISIEFKLRRKNR